MSNTKKMKQFYTLLKRMEARPQIWTGELSLKSIRIFLNAYSLAIEEYGLDELTTDDGFNFHDWVANRLGFYESTAGWQNMILAVSLGLNPRSMEWENYDAAVTVEQHEASIQKFYELLEDYMKEER